MFRKLRGKLRELDIDQSYMADQLDLCQAAVSHRMTSRTPWRLNEMYIVMDLIGEPYDRLHIYFPPGGRAT